MAGGPVIRRLEDDGMAWQRVEARRNPERLTDQRSGWLDSVDAGAETEE